MIAGAEPTLRTVHGVLSTALLPAGRYVARARVVRDGNVAGVLVRPFILDPPEATSAAPPSPFKQGAIAEFDPRVATTPQILGSLLDSVEKRFPEMEGPLVEARAGRYGTAAIEALLGGDQAAAAFFKGLDWYLKGQLNQAATQLELASGPRREFFAASFYLGAVFATAGRDRDAAGVWQIALGDEPRPLIAYTLLADARLRDGQPGSVIDVLEPAYERMPENDEIGGRAHVGIPHGPDGTRKRCRSLTASSPATQPMSWRCLPPSSRSTRSQRASASCCRPTRWRSSPGT